MNVVYVCVYVCVCVCVCVGEWVGDSLSWNKVIKTQSLLEIIVRMHAFFIIL